MDYNSNILIIDDDKTISFLIISALGDKYNIFSAEKIKEAVNILKDESIDVILLDIEIGSENGLEAIPILKNESKFSEIIMLTGSSKIKDVVTAMKLGAFDYLHKPFELSELNLAVEKALLKINTDNKMTALEEDIGRLKKFEDLIFSSPIMEKVINTIKTIGPLDTTILIKGESGTGKELVAMAIHNNSKRKNGPFVAVNCAAIPENLFEAEMFGFEKGAFTGAIQTKKGKFEIAHGGTIFLDEISSLNIEGQASLLRSIERKEIERVGSNRKIAVDIRILAATNKNLPDMVQEGKFREDLYYRLNVIPIDIPPLKDRKEDIKILVSHFIEKYNFVLGKSVSGADEGFLQYLESHNWPGNVRELENIIERSVALCPDSTKISIDNLPIEIIMSQNPLVEDSEPITFEASKKQFEKDLIIAALEKSKYNRTVTARMLGIHINTLLKKINDLKIIIPNSHQ